MKRFNPETKTFKVFQALYNGETLTASQASKRFGVKNLAAEASRIRQGGYAVYANSRTAGNGVTVTEYELGHPSREIVALGYMAKAAGWTVA
jgi:cobalamin biosynthesis protein CbiG